MTDKCKASDQDIYSFHENKLINDRAKDFNEQFNKAASNIGGEESIRDDETIDIILCTYNGSEAIQHITCNVLHDEIFNFSLWLWKLPPKLLKMGEIEVCHRS